jgi:steroid delta-isomerase-like uncharacterized protein
MSIEENKALIRRIYDLINQREIYAYIDLLAPGCVEHLANGDISREQVRQFESDWFKAFPDIKANIEEMVAEGDKVAVRVNYQGTHRGEFMGIAPTGNKIDITNANTLKITDGKIVEVWNVTDIRFLQQLGVIPEQ